MSFEVGEKVRVADNIHNTGTGRLNIGDVVTVKNIKYRYYTGLILEDINGPELGWHHKRFEKINGIENEVSKHYHI